MPIGPFKDFKACVAAQIKNGKNEVSANRICGALEKKAGNTGEENFSFISMLANADGNSVSIIEVLRVGKVLDRGLEITEEMLEDFVKNFNDNVYGTEIQVNLGHDRDGEAAGWIKKLIKEGETLLASVEWTPLGIEKIQSKQFKFTSSEFAKSFPDAKTGKAAKNVFIGVALTNIPAVKGMAAVSLSEYDQINSYINNQTTMSKFATMLAELKEKDSVTKDEFKELTKLAEEEGTDEAKAEAAKVEDKVEEEKVADPEPKKEDDPEPAKDPEPKKEGEGDEGLSEKLDQTNQKVDKLTEENEKLNSKIKLSELTEDVKNTLALSEGNLVGFIEKDVDEVVKFMMSLTDAQAKEFKELVGKVQKVDLSTHGSPNADNVINALTEDAVVKLTDEILDKNPEMDVVDAQKAAVKQLSGK